MNVSRILFFLAGLTLAGAARGGTLYAVDSTTDSLYTLNKTTGASTLIGATGQELDEAGMTFDSSTGRLIVSNLFVQGSIDASGIGFTAPGSATLTAPSDYVRSLSIPSLAYHGPSDTLYGLSNNAYQWQIIDRATGASSNGPVPAADPPAVVFLLAVAFSRDGATLYGVSQFGFHLVDRTTAHITTIGTHGLDLSPFFAGFGLAVDPDDGTLYLSNSVNGNLYRVNPATGAATLIGATGIHPTGLAVVGGPTIEVPTLGQTGLAALVLLMGAIGAVVLRLRFAAVRG
ncbi:MAG TPA: IPTL-CTERM sorting domain-containing protein [Thermoanaerobaculia bacterium]|nr:IPTL-CTERM sorting domain-containing protein [Thermoanaerobaculia bacterium]